MSLPHFFLEDQILSEISEPSFPLLLSSEDLKHARVLRLNPGEHIAVVDAASDYFECAIDSFDSRELVVHIAQHLDASRRPQVVLLQGLAKGERMDSIIRQATEVGVASIVPLLCERSIVKLDEKKTKNRMARWNSITKSAAMQSGRSNIPELSTPMKVNQAANTLDGFTAVLVCWEEAPLSASFSKAIQTALNSSGCLPKEARIAVIVGPEGGLTRNEVETFLACNLNAASVSLGPSILRTETAGVLAPALALYELEGR